MAAMGTDRVCSSGCGATLPITDFPLSRGKHVGRICKVCKARKSYGSLSDKEKERLDLFKEGKKRCGTCREVKDLDSFCSNGVRTSSVCGYCSNERLKAYHRLNPEINRAKAREKRLREMGLTLDRYEELLKEQNFLCKTCKLPETRISKNAEVYQFNIDHDHSCCAGQKSCGKCVRGLLCYSCNVILGHARDNAERLRSLASYLDEWEDRR